LVFVPVAPFSAEAARLCDLPFENGAADDFVVVAFPNAVMTARSLRVEATRYARALLGLGARSGDRVAVYAAPSPELIAAIFGLAMIGVVIVPANNRYLPYELDYVFEHAGVSGVVTTSETDRNFLASATEAAPDHAWIIDLAAQTVTGSSDAHVNDLAEHHSAEDAHSRRAAIRRDELTMICYTSGTTARPKGVMVDNDIVRGYLNIAARLTIGAGDVCYSPTPMFHIAGLGAMIMAVGSAATLVTCPYFHADDALRQLRDYPPTVMLTLFPPLTLAVLQHEMFEPSILERVRVAVQVGPTEVQSRLETTLASGSVVSTYGLSESGTGLTTLGLPDDPAVARLSSCGRPLPGHEVRIADPDSGRLCAPGEAGEIQLRAFAAPGKPYYRNPDATAAARTVDEWFKTGDRGVLTADGRLVFQDRMKDMLRVGGENVSPAEIESLLMQHEAVALAQVVGVPHERLDEVPVAFVELEPGANATPAELLHHCNTHLARFKRPRAIRIVDVWPMSATKVQKSKLREMAAA
jgi:fatty-acyl-CoA synthase